MDFELTSQDIREAIEDMLSMPQDDFQAAVLTVLDEVISNAEYIHECRMYKQENTSTHLVDCTNEKNLVL